MFNIEKELRNDEESFKKVRQLSPTAYRFRVLDVNGHDISATQHAEKYKADISTKPDSHILLKPVHHYGCGPNHCTRVECAKPK